METFSYFTCIVTIVVVVFFLYEAQTATNQLSKYERSVAIIEKLESFKLDNKESKLVVTHIYSGLAKITEPNSSQLIYRIKAGSSCFGGPMAVFLFVLYSRIFSPGYRCSKYSWSINSCGYYCRLFGLFYPC